MRNRTSRRTLLVSVLVVSVASLALAGGAGARRASGTDSQTKTDPAGDSNGAPDLRAITISDMDGVLTFTVIATGLAVAPGSGVDHNRLTVALDTDHDQATGPSGFEHALVYQVDGEGRVMSGVFAAAKNGHAARLPISSGLVVGRSGDRTTFTIDAAELGIQAFGAFNAVVVGSSKNAADKVLATDYGPNNGFLTQLVQPATSYPTRTWTLPGGRASSGPEVTRLTIEQGVKLNATGAMASTGAVGGLRFDYTVANLDPTAVSGATDASVLTPIDVNDDGKADYAIVFGVNADGPYGVLVDAAGKVVPKSPTLSSTAGADGKSYTFMLGTADIGGATGFDFKVVAGTRDASGTFTPSTDPSGTAWTSYDLGVKPLIGTAAVSPSVPVPGKGVTLAIPLRRSDTFTRLIGATLAVSAKIPGATVPHTERFENGTLTVHLTVPASADGKRLTVIVSAKLGTRVVTRATSLRTA
jgi:hypothetical protein